MYYYEQALMTILQSPTLLNLRYYCTTYMDIQ